MLPRPFTHILALALGLIAPGLVAIAIAQPPADWHGAYIPVPVNNSAASDPYALIGNAPSSGVITAGGGPSLFTTSSLITPSSMFFPAGPQTYGSRFWLSTDYLLWKTDGMYTPPLVTTSRPGTPQDQAAILGEPGTSILFGGRRLNDDAVSGFRMGTGYWLTGQQTFGIEGEYFRLGQQVSRYSNGSDGTMILGRPFFDIVEGRENAQLVSYPDLVAGAISVEAKSNLQSALINGRAALCPVHGHGCNCGRGDRVDWIVGYRFLELKDQLTINESLASLLPTEPGTIDISDRFQTTNQFNGLQLGLVHRATYHRAWLESMLRVAVGRNRQSVDIFGNRAITEDGLTDFVDAGLLTQPTNIGAWRRNEFVMVPEVGMNFGMRLTKCFHSTIGFTAIYLPNVVRAGDQVDTDLNTSFISPDGDFVGAPRPRFAFVSTDFWAYGLTLGGELRF